MTVLEDDKGSFTNWAQFTHRTRVDLCLKEHWKIRSNKENDTKWKIFLICCGPVSASAQRVSVERLRTEGSNLKPHLKDWEHPPCSDHPKHCAQTAALTTTLWYKMVQGNLLQNKTTLSHTEGWTHFLITLRNYYYQKFRNTYLFSSSCCIFSILYDIFTFLFQGLLSCIL